MKVKSIDFDDNGYPEALTVVMTRREAQYIAKLTGGQSPVAADAFMPGYSATNDDIYSALANAVFNPFWGEGVNDAIAGKDR